MYDSIAAQSLQMIKNIITVFKKTDLVVTQRLKEL